MLLRLSQTVGHPTDAVKGTVVRQAAYQMLELPYERAIALFSGLGSAMAMAVIGVQRNASFC